MTNRDLTNNVELKWHEFHDFLSFTFPEVFSVRAAKEAINEWDKAMAEQPGKLILVWDLKQVRYTDNYARILWQNAILKHKHRIDYVMVVSDRTWLTISVHFMAFMCGIRMRSMNNWIKVLQRRYLMVL